MRLRLTATVGLILAAGSALVAQQNTPNVIRHDQQLQQYRQMIDRGIEYLRLRGQAADGSFSGKSGIGPTALVVSALLQVGQAPRDPMVQQGLKFLKAQVQADGGIYSNQSLHRSYETCIAVVAFHLANQDGQYDQIVAQAEKYIRGIQWDESEGVERTDMSYGGAGYGSQSRPDLSNTSFLIDTLRSLGNGPDDEAIQKALIFVSRCQNLETPYNDSKHAAAVDDGGFYYTVAAGGESKAEPLPGGGLRSYGSMSYAGLKSMIYAGVNKDDVRVRAVLDFLRKNYDVQSNPGMGQQGLFYYYHTLAKALDAAEIKVFDDASGKSHDWKQQLRDRLAQLQHEDGSWVNPTTRWMEGDPNLVSAYVLLALAHCKP